MSTVLEHPAGTARTSGTAPDRLRQAMAAMRLSFTWFGTRKTLTTEQRSQAAAGFGAEGDFLSAGKKLIDTSHPKFKAVSSIKSQAVSYWKANSLPFPEPGVRLIRRGDLETMQSRMASLRGELDEAVTELDQHFAELKSAARNRLGSLYDADDYPSSLDGEFGITWEFPSVEPPPYLRQLAPELYQQECQRMRARFSEAVQLAEQAFLEELSGLVEHLADRLSGQADGKPKVFRDSAITNLTEFFQRFGRLNINSNSELDELVANAQRIVRGVLPQQLRDSDGIRQHVAEQLSAVSSSLDHLLVDRPRRNIQRGPR